MCGSVNNEQMEKVVCAAVMASSGMIYAGVRHFDTHMIFRIDVEGFSDNKYTEGFVTNLGRFVDRREAASIAVKAGQIDHGTDYLLTEHLY